MDGNRTLLDILSSVLGEYLTQRTGHIRKSTVTGLVIAMLLLISLAVFSFAFIVLIGDAIGSYCGAAFIVGVIYLALAVIFFVFMRRSAQPKSDNWKALLLLLVRNLRNGLDG